MSSQLGPIVPLEAPRTQRPPRGPQAEDEIMGKRDALIAQLEKRLAQKTEIERLFTVRWSVQ